MIHACGMVDLVADVACSPDVVAAARDGAAAPARRSSATRRWSPPASPARGCPRTTRWSARCATRACRRSPRELGTTRSAAALELWRDRLDGAVVAIGNAPTALFRLLELLAAGGAPAGRGARHPGRLHRRGRVEGGAGRRPDLEHLVVHGRRGGSAIDRGRRQRARRARRSERVTRTAVRRRPRARRPGAGDGQGRPADRRGRRGRLPRGPARPQRSRAAIAAPYLRAGQIEEPLVYPVTTETTDHPGGYQGAIDEFYDDGRRPARRAPRRRPRRRRAVRGRPVLLRLVHAHAQAARGPVPDRGRARRDLGQRAPPRRSAGRWSSATRC